MKNHRYIVQFEGFNPFVAPNGDWQKLDVVFYTKKNAKDYLKLVNSNKQDNRKGRIVVEHGKA